MLVPVCQTALCHIPEDSNIITYGYVKLRSHTGMTALSLTFYTVKSQCYTFLCSLIFLLNTKNSYTEMAAYIQILSRFM
jgi:hypothetical protein